MKKIINRIGLILPLIILGVIITGCKVKEIKITPKTSDYVQSPTIAYYDHAPSDTDTDTINIANTCFANDENIYASLSFDLKETSQVYDTLEVKVESSNITALSVYEANTARISKEGNSYVLNYTTNNQPKTLCLHFTCDSLDIPFTVTLTLKSEDVTCESYQVYDETIEATYLSTYYDIETNSYIIDGIGDNSIANIVIPSHFGQRPVTGIDDEAFKDCVNVQSISIPDTITYIGKDVFEGCTNLKYNIYDNGQYVGNDANPYLVFVEATDTTITSCNIHRDCQFIMNKAFYNCSSLESLTVSYMIKSMGDEALKGCSHLKEVSLASQITRLGWGLFSGCSSLKSITLPFVGESTSSNTYLGYLYGATSYEENCSYVPSYLKEVTLLTGCLEIPAYAFYQCRYLETINFSNTITRIDTSAFEDCTSLTSITFSNNLTSIGSSALGNCSSLTALSLPNSLYDIESYAFAGCVGLTQLTIPSNVSYIAEGIFQGCSALESLTLPQITFIGELFGASSYNDNGTVVPATLKEVIFNEGCKSITPYAFKGCTSLERVTLSSNTESVGEYAFQSCTSLTSVTIPDKSIWFNDYVFKDCSALTHIIIPSDTEHMGFGIFSHCSTLESISVPYFGSYSTTTDQFLSYMFGSLTADASYIPASLKEVTLTGDATVLNTYCFNGCTHLVTVTLSDSIKVLSDYTFNNCSSLETITLPNSIKIRGIGPYAIANCTSLKDIYYQGTIEEWNSITKYSDWNKNTGNYTIHCIDGDIAKS